MTKFVLFITLYFTKKSNVQSVSQNQQNTIAEFNQTRFGCHQSEEMADGIDRIPLLCNL